MAAEAGHEPNRTYTDQDGALHVNGASLFNDSEVDVSALLESSSPTADDVAVAADVLAIPVTHRVVLKTTGADAEALTLANGSPGQLLTIVLATDGGGDGTLTPTTKTGFATIVFADAGDQVTLQYLNDTLGWVIVGYAGASAPPVITV